MNRKIPTPNGALLKSNLIGEDCPEFSLGTYTIRPLKWEKKFSDEREEFRADVPMGSYTVSRTRVDYDAEKPWENWKWEYCFDEYYDESYDECDHPDDGKMKCWENWVNRILPALEKLRQPT